MTKKEWQQHNGITDQEMEQIAACLNIFNGTMVSMRQISTDKQDNDKNDKPISTAVYNK